ncbi:MAG TPA: MBL fold metallo-hydrolase [Xanthobacteraceae bacterium]|nr:MBL fold metallo-hydrolase [Xanthobacteraceae bacterium]
MPLNYYDGPVSDHWDGTRFGDAHSVRPKSSAALWRWRWERKPAEWPAHLVNEFADKPPARIDDESWRICHVGHATNLIQTAGLNILTDPIWSERSSPISFAGPKRATDPGVTFDALPKIDIVLVTHNHYDHLDAPTLIRLAQRDNPRVITPLGNDTIIKSYDSTIRTEAYDWGQRADLGNGLATTLVPAQHWSARGFRDRNKALWCTFIIETPAGKIYHVGDTGYGDGFYFKQARAQHGPFRLAILPIGAYEPRWFMRDQHMNPEEAVKAFNDLGVESAIGHHYGTFQLTDEAIDAPLIALDDACKAAEISSDKFRVLRPGQVWEL